ncbi:nitroreductase family protein [Peptostreptococcus equinus]|uniref:Nitroreductase family protein n=1 Tax=Peptostreptococcus equinus TaxID=3003601 RepID=A0ABY7JS73_9FIRM|nr:nitroreductase family protein [Peptostreptococcus sp. CBA3647]WAW15346.1 nitroreductase family protein [Peptostreptococcus sp. CBA3647]
MKFNELVRKNRTCRRFDESNEVKREDLMDIMETTRFAASGANKQPLRFLVVNSDEGNEKVFANIAWAGYLKEWPGPIEGERPRAYIVIAEDEKYAKAMGEDVGIAAQTIALAARDKGMAVCMFKAFRGKNIKEEFNLDKSINILMVIAIGYPVEEVVTDDIKLGEDIKYYRDEKEIHHVPKFTIDDIVL